MTKLLLLMGCSWNLCNMAMHYPRTVARLNNHTEVAEVLEQEELLQQIYGDEINIDGMRPIDQVDEEDYGGRGSMTGDHVLRTSGYFWRNMHKNKKFFASQRSEQRFLRKVREFGRAERERVKKMLEEDKTGGT